MHALLLRLKNLFFPSPISPVQPEEDPNRPAWNREAWKQAGRRGYRPTGGR